MTDGNLFSVLAPRFAALGDKPAFARPDGEPLVSYGGLLAEVNRMANALDALGLAPGDRVTVQAEKSIAWVALYLAVLKRGGVFQPLNPAYTLPEVEYFVADAQPAIVVCDPVRQSASRAIGDKHGVTAVMSLDRLAELASGMAPRAETIARAPDDLAGLLYTSGTTGRAKGAMLSHDNLASNAETLLRLWAFRPDDVLLHALPVFHVHGLFVALNTAFLNGSTIVWFDRFDVDLVLDALPRATMMMGVPTFYTRLLASPRLDAALCRSIRVFICGSAPLLAETHRAFAARTGHTILERYGMTETGMICSNPYDGARIAGTVGFALPGVDVRIAEGVVEVKGPNVFKGYWRMAEKTAEDFRADGYFITGDLGAMDSEGRVTIEGRAKDLIITGGFNVYPKEIEQALDALPGIVESAVIGVPHPDFGEAVVAVVTCAALIAEADILAALSEHLAKFKLPKRVFAVDDLPRNAMGKVQKAELRQRHEAAFAAA